MNKTGLTVSNFMFIHLSILKTHKSKGLEELCQRCVIASNGKQYSTGREHLTLKSSAFVQFIFGPPQSPQLISGQLSLSSQSSIAPGICMLYVQLSVASSNFPSTSHPICSTKGQLLAKQSKQNKIRNDSVKHV